MTIVKLSKSGKALIFIDDFGNSYSTSTKYLMSLVSGRMKAPFIQLSRFPVPVEQDRFKKSPVLGKEYEKIEPDDDRWTQPQCSHNVEVTSSEDAGIDQRKLKKDKVKETFTDVQL